MNRRIAIETWDPDYGNSVEPAVLDASGVDINSGVELPADRWQPLDPPAGTPRPARILFIDGVRRTDAYAWITEGNEPPFRGMLASFGAGAVLAGSEAKVVDAAVRRVLVSANPTEPIATRAGAYEAVPATGDSPEELSQALQQRLTQLEIEIADRHAHEAEMVVIDGPIRGRQDPGGIGYIKSHRVAYLPEALHGVVAALAAGQRTPVFFMSTSWARYAWYLRLPGPANHAWWGIVRCEVSEALPRDEVIARAHQSAAVLPRFASAPHKDPRAPQNLHPIAGLERHLRNLMGDPSYVQRCIRVAGG